MKFDWGDGFHSPGPRNHSIDRLSSSALLHYWSSSRQKSYFPEFAYSRFSFPCSRVRIWSSLGGALEIHSRMAIFSAQLLAVCAWINDLYVPCRSARFMSAWLCSYIWSNWWDTFSTCWSCSSRVSFSSRCWIICSVQICKQFFKLMWGMVEIPSESNIWVKFLHSASALRMSCKSPFQSSIFGIALAYCAERKKHVRYAWYADRARMDSLMVCRLKYEVIATWYAKILASRLTTCALKSLLSFVSWCFSLCSIYISSTFVYLVIIGEIWASPWSTAAFYSLPLRKDCCT